MFTSLLPKNLIRVLLMLSVCSRLLGEAPVPLTEPTPAGPVVDVSSTRAEIVLNGLWRWLPAAGPSEKAPAITADWGVIWVPGAWGTRMWGHYKNENATSSFPGVQHAGKGEEWTKWNEELKRGWYEREITVPADWEKRAVVLSFDRIATDAELWLDGVHVGGVAWPAGEIDITRHITFGKAQRLRLLVSAVQTAKEAIDYMGVGQNTTVKASLDLRGVTGDVVLTARPITVRITDVFVKTSTRKQRIDIDCEFAGIAPGTSLALEAVVSSLADGSVVRTFRANAVALAPDAEAAPTSSSVVRNVGWDWSDARLWDTNDPYLYRLELKVSRAGGTTVDDAWPVTFGFREFWTEGREFYLNGTRIRLRPALYGGFVGVMPTTETLAAEFARLHEHGKNLVEVWPSPKDRGGRVQDATVAEAADRAGMLLIVPSVRINEYAMGGGHRPIWATLEGRDTWLPLYRADWRRLRNHPSIVVMALSGNLGGHNHDQNPLWIGRRGMPSSIKMQDNFIAMAEADKLATAFDPTRLRMHHQGGMFGDIFSVNHYMNFIPLQEREEWFSEWARTGDMPYMSVEFGTPFNATYLRGRDGFGNSIVTEPFLAEYSAVYFGSEAYALQGDLYARTVGEGFVRANEKTGGLWKNWQQSPELSNSPVFQAMAQLFVARTWRSWRTAGVSGGMIPWDGGYAVIALNTDSVPQVWQAGRRGWFVPRVRATALAHSYRDGKNFRLTPVGETFEANNSPTLAWIAGAADNIHEKRHHLAQGDTINKQLALLNDTRVKQVFSAKWQVESSDGAILSQGEENGQLGVGETRLLPVSYTSGSEGVAAGEKRDLSFVLSADIGGLKHEDRFAFRVYGPAAESAAPSIVLYDPVGHTARLLKELGVAYAPFVQGTVPASDALLVLGRESLTDGRLPFDLGVFVAAGGRALIMAQNPVSVRRFFGMRAAPVQARRLFPVPTAGAFVEGLDAIDLADWNGAGTMLEAKPDHAAMSPDRPPHGWRWGNNGSVSSAMLEKPHRSGWTPLLEGEWDLAYSPLMELGYGKGRLTFCTLDLEDQAAVDPVAERLARRVLVQAARPVETARAESVVYVGSAKGAAVLRHAGVDF